jgi:hypothetical protein
VGARSIRQAVRDYIAPTAGISNAYKDEPHYVSNDAWYSADGTHGTVAYVHIDQEGETRLVITGFPDGGQQITYHVAIVVLYEYLIPDDEASPDAWVDGLDDLLDALKARLRADPHLGTGPTGVVWSAAQHDNTLTISRDLPKKDGGVVRSWNVLQFQVTENV